MIIMTIFMFCLFSTDVSIRRIQRTPTGLLRKTQLAISKDSCDWGSASMHGWCLCQSGWHVTSQTQHGNHAISWQHNLVMSRLRSTLLRSPGQRCWETRGWLPRRCPTGHYISTAPALSGIVLHMLVRGVKALPGKLIVMVRYQTIWFAPYLVVKVYWTCRNFRKLW